MGLRVLQRQFGISNARDDFAGAPLAATDEERCKDGENEPGKSHLTVNVRPAGL